jgi:hypothetical protein
MDDAPATILESPSAGDTGLLESLGAFAPAPLSPPLGCGSRGSDLGRLMRMNW